MFESKRFWMISTFSLLGLNLIVIIVFAWMMNSRPEQRKMDNLDPVLNIARRLELSENQRDSMKVLLQNSDRRTIYHSMMGLRHQLLIESANSTPNQDRIDSILTELGNFQIILERETFMGMRNLHQISDENQRIKYQKMIDRIERKYRKRHQNKALKND
jgi:hypothetical protein